MFRCVARYGYTDPLEGPKKFAAFLLDRLKMFIQEEAVFAGQCADADDGQVQPGSPGNDNDNNDALRRAQAAEEEENRFIDAEAEHGVVYLMGEANVTAVAGSSVMMRIVVNYVYTFLRKNLREGHTALSIPKDQLLKVGITYEI